ncbi:hypothetical protein KAR91_84070 [Candidatus Pacearchaeota archaeon]|nr:hypothetical protein [Candidatus Pacearchaeota archaeon]
MPNLKPTLPDLSTTKKALETYDDNDGDNYNWQLVNPLAPAVVEAFATETKATGMQIDLPGVVDDNALIFIRRRVSQWEKSSEVQDPCDFTPTLKVSQALDALLAGETIGISTGITERLVHLFKFENRQLYKRVLGPPSRGLPEPLQWGKITGQMFMISAKGDLSKPIAFIWNEEESPNPGQKSKAREDNDICSHYNCEDAASWAFKGGSVEHFKRFRFGLCDKHKVFGPIYLTVFGLGNPGATFTRTRIT